MTRISWDDVGQRFADSGLDQGVLYLADGTGIPWNGLTAVEEDPQEESEPLYFDGVKIRDVQKYSDWTGTIRAITFPDELLDYEGTSDFGNGMYATDQDAKPFSMSYRTMVRNDLDFDYGSKIHIVYNITAVPDDRDYESISDQPTPTEFSWSVSAFPVEVLGVKPSAHIIFDPRAADSFLITQMEEILYGSDTVDASLPPFAELYQWLMDYTYMTITDNGDGTWTATSEDPDAIVMVDSENFELHGVALTFTQPTDPTQYTIQSGGAKEE